MSEPVKDPTPAMTEFRDKIDFAQLHEAIVKVIGESKRLNQKLLVVWRGTESSRFATFALNNSRGWVGQYDTLTPYLRSLITAGKTPVSLFEKELSDGAIQQISEHSDYKLPMMLIVWNPNDSVVFEMHFANKPVCWTTQLEGLIIHLLQISQYQKENAWSQADYMHAQQELANQQRTQGMKPKIVIPH